MKLLSGCSCAHITCVLRGQKENHHKHVDWAPYMIIRYSWHRHQHLYLHRHLYPSSLVVSLSTRAPAHCCKGAIISSTGSSTSQCARHWPLQLQANVLTDCGCVTSSVMLMAVIEVTHSTMAAITLWVQGGVAAPHHSKCCSAAQRNGTGQSVGSYYHW